MKYVWKVICWMKGIGIGPGGRSWWSLRYQLPHPLSNQGQHDYEKVNIREINDVTIFDFQCKRCGSVSDNWQEVTDKNAREVVADFYMH